MTLPPPLLDVAERQVEQLTGSPLTPMWFRLIHPAARRPAGVPKVLTPHLYGAPADVWPQIAAAQASGYDVYVVPNAGGNTARDITSIRAVWADKDGDKHGPAQCWQDVQWHTPPDFIVFRGDNTGRETIRQGNADNAALADLTGGADCLSAAGLLSQDYFWHAYWRVADCPVAAFEAAQKRLAARYGSDPGVHDPSRVMRLAGTLHTKGEPRYVNLAWRT